MVILSCNIRSRKNKNMFLPYDTKTKLGCAMKISLPSPIIQLSYWGSKNLFFALKILTNWSYRRVTMLIKKRFNREEYELYQTDSSDEMSLGWWLRESNAVQDTFNTATNVFPQLLFSDWHIPVTGMQCWGASEGQRATQQPLKSPLQ